MTLCCYYCCCSCPNTDRINRMHGVGAHLPMLHAGHDVGCQRLQLTNCLICQSIRPANCTLRHRGEPEQQHQKCPAKCACLHDQATIIHPCLHFKTTAKSRRRRPGCLQKSIGNRTVDLKPLTQPDGWRKASLLVGRCGLISKVVKLPRQKLYELRTRLQSDTPPTIQGWTDLLTPIANSSPRHHLDLPPISYMRRDKSESHLEKGSESVESILVANQEDQHAWQGSSPLK